MQYQCNLCGVETSEGNLCQTCNQVIEILFQKYDLQSLTRMFTQVLGAKMVDDIVANLTQRMEEEYGQSVLNQVDTDNPQ